jgi:hypothetical protein
MTTLLPEQILGFPPVCRRGVGRGNPGALQERMAAPAGVTASVLDIRNDFSQPPKNHDPVRSITLRQPHHPTARATTVLGSRPPSHRGEATMIHKNVETTRAKQRLDNDHAGGRAQPPLPPVVTDRTQLQEQTRPLLARPSPVGT